MKRLKFKKIAVAALSAVGLTALSVGASGCLPKSTDLTEPENIEITRTAPPDDGSLPTAHTCAENLAYINYVFDNQTQYHTYSYGVTSASIATQTTRNFRDYKDGILMNTDLTHSSMVKSGTQTCSMYNEEGEYEVYFRTSAAPDADTLPAQADWSEEAPKIFDEHSYHYTYGLLPNELFNYIVNEQNIIDSDQIQVNSDGTFTQSFTLNPTASTYFYQFGMKTRGGLSGYPEFESIQFTVTFDDGWRILSASMHEVAKVNKGIVVTSISDFNTQYWYGDDHFDSEHFAFYESYFKNYIGDTTLEQGGSGDEKLTIDVTNVLSNGFSQIMNGGEQFEISLQLGENRYTGLVFVSLDLADPLGTLALKVSLGKSLREQTLFIEYVNGELAAYYGDDFALNANLAEVKLAVDEFGEIIDKITAAFSKGGGAETQPSTEPTTETLPEAQAEQADPLTELMNAMVLTAGEKQAVLTLDTDNLLGLGIGINARLVFGINNNKIIFRNASIGGLSIGGEDVDLGVTLLTTTAPAINREPSKTGANLAEYIADVHSLLGADLIKVTANLNGSAEKVSIDALKGLNAKVTAYADLDGVTVGAQADVSYTYNGQTVSAKAEIWYGYDASKENYGTAVVALTEFNGVAVDLKISCDIKQVVDAVGTLITFAGGDGGAATSGLAGIVNGALSSDFSSLLTELYADKAQIKIGVSVDAILDMLNVNAGIKFGSCALKYQRGEGVYGGVLSAELPALGLDISVCGESGAVAEPDTQNCLDLSYVIADVKELLNADLIKAHIALDGSAEGVTVTQLQGLAAGIDVYFNAQQIAVAADIDLSYTYGEDKVSAKLSAWYDKGETELGKIVLSLTEINGVPLAAKVYCDITEIKEAVTALLNYADIKLKPFENSGSEQSADIITKILGADFKELLPELKTSSDGINIAVNVKQVLSLFGITANADLGNLSLVYSHKAQNKLVAAAPAVGLTAEICGATGTLSEMPDPADCLDLTKVVNTVQAVWEQVDGIIDGQSIAFEIIKGETFLSLDGILVEIWGEGEVCWKQGGEYVALDLAMSITERASDVATFKFIYDKNAVTTPLVKLALNEVGIEIYKDDIESVKSGFNSIYNKVMALLGKSNTQTQPATPENGNAETLPAAPENGTESSGSTEATQTTQNALDVLTGNDNLMGVIFGLLASDGWVDILNDITLKCDGKSLALSYLSDNAVNVEVGADGNLSLFYDGAFGKRFSLSGGLVASAVCGNLCDVIESKFETCKMSSSKAEGSAGFVKLAYDFLFEAISKIDVSNILGSDTYTVTFNLDGNNCNVTELKDVLIGAEIYITGASGEQGKLAEANLNINAAGVVIKLNVITERRGSNTYFYINLSQVAGIKLPDLKFMATQQSLYETFDVLIKTINKTNILDAIGKLIGGTGSGTDGTASAPAQSGEQTPVVNDALADKLADIITKVLNFNFNKAVVATETDGVTTATIDLDNIVKQLGINTGALGTVEAVINHNNHSMKTSGKTLVTDLNGNSELKEWISLSSELAARRDYSKFDRAEYISIEFLPTLIDDVVKFATDDKGDMHTSFTLSGNIKANLVNMIDVNIDPCVVTANIGKDGLSVSLVMHVNKAKVIGIGIPESTVGLTYRNGLLTLAKGLNGTNPEYKVMTFDYFLDHMLTKNDSVLQWLLDISGWELIMSFVKVDINSGLTSPEDISLFETSAATQEQEISMYDFVQALRVIINGNQTAVFGNYNELENDLGIYDNYYGFALNAGLVTNGVLTKLNAAITRSNAGLDRVLASGAIQSYVTFSANLQYNETVTEDYVTGNALESGKRAPDLYAAALDTAAACGYTPDFDYFVKKPDQGYDEKFGCMSVSGSNVTTDYSHILYSHTLTIVKLNGDREERAVRHGSTIHLYDNNSPVYTDDTKTVRVLYSTAADSVGGTEVIMNGDLTVYQIAKASVSVVVHNGSEEVVIYSFEGDRVPTSVEGLETISAPTYEDGTQVGANDIIDGSSSVLHIYGTFVKTETVVNYVKYTFSAESMSYTASGKAAGFNDQYSTKGNTLVLENVINGYPVTAIAENAFANTEGKPISSVIVPENIVTVGQKAFLDNTGSLTLTFLADRVHFLGSKKDKNLPLYGCSTEADGIYNNMIVYYRDIYCDAGGEWSYYRNKNSYDYYIGGHSGIYGDYGGALHSANDWEYVDYAVNVDLNGVSGGTLTPEAVSAALSGYFPYVTTGSYAGSVYEADVNKALTAALGNMNFTRGGISYMCDYTTGIESANGKTTVTFNVSYKMTAEIYVSSAVAFNMYNTDVAANTLTAVTVPVDGDAISLPTPKEATHIFLRWETAESNGSLVYTAVWREKQTYKFTCTVSGNLVSKITLTKPDGTTESQTASAFSKPTFALQIMEGQTVTAKNDGRNLNIYLDGTLTYTINSKNYDFKPVDYNSGIVNGDISQTFNF